MHPLIRSVEAILPRASRQYGMKARNLAALARAGFPVPAAYVLSCEATELFLAHALPPDLQLTQVIESPTIAPGVLDAARERIIAADVPRDVRDALRAAFVELTHAGAQSAIVRPSRIVSDDFEAAVTGLHESTLALASVDAVVQAAQRCWASLYSPAAIHCARSLGTEHVGSLALIIQAMVPAEAAGTLWTANPLTNDASELTLEAVFGLGVGLRDPSITPDLYQIDRRTHWIRDRVVGRKQHAFRVGRQGDVESLPIDTGAQDKEALDDHTLRQMVELGRRIETHFGDPREIEWAVVADAVYVLHARPIASRPGLIPLVESKRGRDDRDLASAQWLNLGAIEPLSDVVTPLTWSALNAFCRHGLPRALSVIGSDNERELQGVRSQRGRAFVDVSELSLLGHGYELFLDGAGQLPGAHAEQRLSALEVVSMPMQLLALARHRRRRARDLPELERNFHVEHARLLSIDPRILSGVGLADTLFDAQRLTDRLMRRLVVCTADVVSSWGLLRRVLATGGKERSRAIELGLLCGIHELHEHDLVGDLEPVSHACRDEAATSALRNGAGGWAELTFEQLSGHEAVGALATYLSAHGHRAVQEFELASPRWAERPGVALAMASCPLAQDRSRSVASRRHAALQVFHRAQNELSQRWGEALAQVAMTLVNAVRQDIVQRERVRGWMLLALNLMRRCVADGSRRLSLRETVLREDAAFLMGLDELRSYLRGEVRAVAQRVTLRRSLQRQIEALPSPPDAFVGYPQAVAAATQWKQLSGAVVSPGEARGAARIIRSLQDLERVGAGDILLLRQLDPAWAPLMCRAGGVCAELGGPLSSGAVMLRQYAIPAVSGLGVSLRSVRDGEMLHLDADNSLVTRIADVS